MLVGFVSLPWSGSRCGDAGRRDGAGAYQLFRLGDAVNSSNVHAAVYDAFRLCLAI